MRSNVLGRDGGGSPVSTTSQDRWVDPRVADRDVFLAAVGTGMTLAFWAARHPDLPALISPQGTRTFAELNAEANRLARAWRARGVASGDAVAAMISNRPEFVIVLAAAQRSGLRLTPINWHLTGDEAAYVVDDCEARVLVADHRFVDVALFAAERATRPMVRMAVGGAIAGFEDLDVATAREDPSDLPDPELGGTMLYTSGTTGRPKGVRRSPA